MIRRPHRWDVTPKEAMQIQRQLARRVVEQGRLDRFRFVAGVDVGFEGEGNRTARAAVVVLDFPGLKPVEYAAARAAVTFPYIPGLLSFRELPVVLQALAQLEIVPDVFLVDGHGRSHPRRMGIACHLGVLLDLPAIGCAKSVLYGQVDDPANRVGAQAPILDDAEQIGAAVRTRKGVRPVYVSIGHRVSLDRAVDVVLECCKGYRLPETTRWAHRIAGGESIEMIPAQKNVT